jgi:hypothetical protein
MDETRQPGLWLGRRLLRHGEGAVKADSTLAVAGRPDQARGVRLSGRSQIAQSSREPVSPLSLARDVGVQVQAELVDQVKPHERPPES